MFMAHSRTYESLLRHREIGAEIRTPQVRRMASEKRNQRPRTRESSLSSPVPTTAISDHWLANRAIAIAAKLREAA
jgi:hypothetical protein